MVAAFGAVRQLSLWLAWLFVATCQFVCCRGLYGAARPFWICWHGLEATHRLVVIAVLPGHTPLLFCCRGLLGPRDSLVFGWRGLSRPRADLFVVVAFMGPCDSLDSLARPSRPHVDLFVVAVLSGRVQLLFCGRGLSGPRNSLIFGWCGLSRPRVALGLLSRPSPGCATVGSCWCGLCGSVSISLLSQSFRAA